jgi:hypothetical protein
MRLIWRGFPSGVLETRTGGTSSGTRGRYAPVSIKLLGTGAGSGCLRPGFEPTGSRGVESQRLAAILLLTDGR